MAANEFNVKISIPNRICLDKDAVCVTMPTAIGYVGILHNHIPIVGAIAPGFIHIKYASGQEQIGLLNYGLYYFQNNKLVILSDFFEFSCHGVNVDAITAISQRIEEAAKEVHLSNRAINSLNSYMKLVGLKAKQTNKEKK